MTERLLHPDSLEASAAPAYLRERARTEGKQIKQIIGDRAGGHPRHAWGFIQWSLRPFEQRGGCDGTTDPNIHLIALCLCEALGLDYPALYERENGPVSPG